MFFNGTGRAQHEFNNRTNPRTPTILLSDVVLFRLGNKKTGKSLVVLCLCSIQSNLKCQNFQSILLSFNPM